LPVGKFFGAAGDPRPLPRSGLVLSPLGLGTAALGDRGGADAASNAARTVELALEHGISYVDTAPHYAVGTAERRIGAALGARPRDSFTLSTKVGRIIDEAARTERYDYSPGAVRASLEASLSRLGLARADILYVHDPDYGEAEDSARDGAFPALRAMRAEGTIRSIGAGMNQAGMLDRFVTDASVGVDVVLLAGRYTLLDTSGVFLLDRCLERGVGVVLGGVFNSGILADPKPGARYDYRAAPAELVARARAMARVCERHGVPLPAAALRFGWGHPAVVSVLNGAGSPGELADNLAHAAAEIPAALWDQLRAEELLPASVPAPVEVA
jgi:D-threo-aldose 1-dehydrogenase